MHHRPEDCSTHARSHVNHAPYLTHITGACSTCIAPTTSNSNSRPCANAPCFTCASSVYSIRYGA